LASLVVLTKLIDCVTDGREEVTGPEGTRAAEGHWSEIVYAANGLKVGGNLFWHKNIQKWDLADTIVN